MWYISTPPDDDAAAPKCLRRTMSGPAVIADQHRNALLHHVADEVAEHAPVHHRLSTGTPTSMRCVPRRGSSRCSPQSGILPVSIAALVLSRPSVLVRAPSTELQ